LKERFVPRKGKVYSLSREREKVQAFVEDQLQKGWDIFGCQNYQISPVHFVAKKNGKRRMVQDYRHVNQ